MLSGFMLSGKRCALIAIFLLLTLFVQVNRLFAIDQKSLQPAELIAVSVEGPTASILADTIVVAGVTPVVKVSVSLASNLELIAAGFSITYDQECLSFIDTDADQNGIQDGIKVTLPNQFAHFFNYDDQADDSQLDFAIVDLLPPHQILPNGPILELTFVPTCYPPHNESRFARIGFGNQPLPDFSNAALQQVPIKLNDSVVEIASPTSGTAILPTTPNNPTVPNTPITPIPGNTPPLANADEIVTDEDVTVVINSLLNDTDEDGGMLSVSAIIVEPESGVVKIRSDGQIDYSPKPNFFGKDSLVYLLNDGQGGSATGAINITVNPVNDPPIFLDFPTSLISTEEEVFELRIRGEDPEVGQEGLMYSVFGLPEGIQFDEQTGQLSGGLAKGSAGFYEVIVILSDGDLTTSGVFQWTVQPNDQNPTGVNDTTSQAYLPLFYR